MTVITIMIMILMVSIIIMVIIIILYSSPFSYLSVSSFYQEYTVFGYIRQYWTDKRFASKFSETIRLKGSTIECAWIPDTYVVNTRESNLLAENSNGGSLFEIQPNGTIFYSRRLVLIPLWIIGVGA